MMDPAKKQEPSPRANCPRCMFVMAAMKEELPVESFCHLENDTATDIFPCQTGVGKVNAAFSLMRLSSDYGWRPGISFGTYTCVVCVIGTAGAVDPSLKIGDIVVCADTLQHDFDVSAYAPLGLKRGQIPFQRTSIWKADKNLLAVAQIAANEVANASTSRVHVGRVISGDQFIADPMRAKALGEEFGALCTDMETAAIAQVCHRMQLPWVGFRIISDTADKQASEDFAAFLDDARHKLYELVCAFVPYLPTTWFKTE